MVLLLPSQIDLFLYGQALPSVYAEDSDWIDLAITVKIVSASRV